MSHVHMDIVIQVKDLLDQWSTEAVFFPSLTEAVTYGKNSFSQNVWRVIGSTAGRQKVLYEHEPELEIEGSARADAHRFRQTEHYREIFARRAEAEERRAVDRQRLENIARSRDDAGTLRHAWPWDDEDEEKEEFERVNWMEEGF